MNPVRSLSRRVVMAVVATVALTAVAAAEDAPPIPKEVTVVTGEQLKKMMDGKDKFLLVDSRIGREYKEGHIPGAIHVYDKEMEAQSAKFPADKGHPIVFFATSYPKCPRSANAADHRPEVGTGTSTCTWPAFPVGAEGIPRRARVNRRPRRSRRTPARELARQVAPRRSVAVTSGSLLAVLDRRSVARPLGSGSDVRRDRAAACWIRTVKVIDRLVAVRLQEMAKVTEGFIRPWKSRTRSPPGTPRR